MILGSGSVHNVGRWRNTKKRDDRSGAKCQKCLQLGHWTYECPNARVHKSRGSRTDDLEKASKKKGLSKPTVQLPDELLPDYQEKLHEARMKRIRDQAAARRKKRLKQLRREISSESSEDGNSNSSTSGSSTSGSDSDGSSSSSSSSGSDSDSADMQEQQKESKSKKFSPQEIRHRDQEYYPSEHHADHRNPSAKLKPSSGHRSESEHASRDTDARQNSRQDDDYYRRRSSDLEKNWQRERSHHKGRDHREMPGFRSRSRDYEGGYAQPSYRAGRETSDTRKDYSYRDRRDRDERSGRDEREMQRRRSSPPRGS